MEPAEPPPAPRSAAGRRAAGAPIEVTLLGGFEVRADGAPVRLGGGGRRLLALLALSPGWLDRGRAAELLYPARPRPGASRNLRATLARLRAALPGAVEVTRTHLRLSPRVAVDVRLVEAIARGRVPAAAAAGGRVDVSRFTADLLPGWRDEWVRSDRDGMRELGLDATGKVAAYEAARGDFGSAKATIFPALRRDPFRESAMLVLLEAILAEGNQSDAVRRYLAFRTKLRAILGVEPSRRLRDLMERLLDEGRGGPP